eukprot:CAMPEP_0119501300 /NCGR_PEP_ID=MMETSP1344-20130328/23180_1 /TAXON_ID=236787 /ORGANISM="Florenciella parvula, Strain CCMP2471" /LENGTH=327 /DNA_ID=CAMNT_0007537457 /DNA_START=1 /DNA_END=984 /DNA_ORIENTATION=+
MGAVGFAAATYYNVIPRSLVGGIGMIVFGLVGAIVVYQENILYMPVIQGFSTPATNPQGYRSPQDQGMEYEDVTVVSKGDVKVHGWFIPAKSGSDQVPTVLFCHENAGNIGLRLQEFGHVQRHLQVNQLVFDYRGYGYSAGKPSEEGLIADSLAMLDWLQDRAARGAIDGSKIVLCGRSLGGAVAVHVAVALESMKIRYPPSCVIVENSFTSISDMVDCKFPFLNIPFFKEQFLRLQWRSIDKVGKITMPMLFLASVQDEIVPFEHMQKLSEAATSARTKTFHQFDATHNDIWVKGGRRYWDAKGSFIKLHAQKRLATDAGKESETC